MKRMASSSEDSDADEFTIQTEDVENRNYSSSSSEEEEEEEEPVPPKKLKREWENSYSTKAMRIMQNMGFESDKGLGKSGQGRLEPIEASKQEGRRGLGLKLDNLDVAAEKWDPTLEVLTVPENIAWLRNEADDLHDLTMEDLSNLVVIGVKKMTIDDETKYCDPEVLANVLRSKTVFDSLSPNDMRRARTRSNPYETIRSSIFLNRAAVKMANIDSLCDYMFTKPVHQNGQTLLKDNDLLYFADICAGPGGFSEYVLYRKQWEAKGFGFTLKGENDFKLHDFYAGPPETFDPYYGVKDDGNIFDPDNINSFTDYVLKQTDIGVHFVMADGGFSVEGQENIQEILSKQLYLCQCLVALSVLRENGHFVVKLFDLFTSFSVGLVYLMYKCFQEISIIKPNTSRPANSERYLVCKWKKAHTDTIRRHLFHINEAMWTNKETDIDTVEIVKHSELCKDSKFINYITERNNEIGRNQIIGLLKIAAFCKDTKLKEERQQEVKEKCLKLWNIPDQIRQPPEKPSVDVLLSNLLHEWSSDLQFMSRPSIELKDTNQLKKHIRSVYDWYFMPIDRSDSAENRTFFLCKGGRDVFYYTPSKSWHPVRNHCFEISPNTLIYAEIVSEMIGVGRSQNKVYALHIIDGIALGGTDIRRYPLAERLKLCEKFARALNKPPRIVTNADGVQQNAAPIRCKKLFPMIEIQSFFDQMSHYKLKDGGERLGYRIRTFDDKAERFFVPGGLIFFNETIPRYSSFMSKRTNARYYLDYETGENFYLNRCNNRDVFSSFRACFYNRLVWKWVNVYQVDECLEDSNRQPEILYRVDFYDFITGSLSLNAK